MFRVKSDSLDDRRINTRHTLAHMVGRYCRQHGGFPARAAKRTKTRNCSLVFVVVSFFSWMSKRPLLAGFCLAAKREKKTKNSSIFFSVFVSCCRSGTSENLAKTHTTAVHRAPPRARGSARGSPKRPVALSFLV